MEFPELSTHPTVRTLVAGLGHPDRGDDAAGLVVADLVAELHLPFTAVRSSTTGLLGLIDEVATAERLLVVDAVLTGAPAGTVVLLHRTEIAAAGAAFSSHGLDLAAEFALLDVLGRLPRDAWVLGVEIASVDAGTGLSPQVAATLDHLVARAASVAGAEEATDVPR